MTKIKPRGQFVHEYAQFPMKFTRKTANFDSSIRVLVIKYLLTDFSEILHDCFEGT